MVAIESGVASPGALAEGGVKEQEGKTMPRYMHPRTGKKLPDVAFFEVGGCYVMDGGQTVRSGDHARGVVHYLATAGTDDWVNPADRERVCAGLERERKVAEERARDYRLEELERSYALCRLECEDSRTRVDLEKAEKRGRDTLSSLEFLENELRSERTVRRPHLRGLEAMRQETYDLRAKARMEKEDAESLRRIINMRTAQTIGLVEVRRMALEEEDRAKYLGERVEHCKVHGFMNVTTSGWQKGRETDIVGLLPTFSWSSYTFFTEGHPPADSPPSMMVPTSLSQGTSKSEPHSDGISSDGRRRGGHPEGRPSGAWFQVDLPYGLRLYPSHYAMRHGDDASQLGGFRHDSDCVMTDACPGEAPKTSWGGTTRARGDFAGAALLDWELWGYAEEEQPLRAGWVLLSKHEKDTTLHGAWATGVWRVKSDGRRIASFRVVMTGPTLNGGYSLFCSGFDVFGQVGEPEKIRPLPKPPRGLQYLFLFELYTVDVDIEPNKCLLESGTNDEDHVMIFTITPALPKGLDLNLTDGTISGRISYDALQQQHKLDVDMGKVLQFVVVADNGIGTTDCIVRMVVMRPPVAFGYDHTDVTYQSKEEKIAFSTEMLEQGALKKWKKPTDGPVDLKRVHSFNKPVKESNFGTIISWQSSLQVPQVAGTPVGWEPPWVWPKFRVEPELLEGLRIDQRTGKIQGAPAKECERRLWTVYAYNPVGEAAFGVYIRVLDPPSGLEYEVTEAVLGHGMFWVDQVSACLGSKPIGYRADTLPIGVSLDKKTGEVAGEPQQVDDDFVEYEVFAWNEVGEAVVTLRLLCTVVMAQQDGPTLSVPMGRIVNKDVSARVGLKVEGTSAFIQWRERAGLADASATPDRYTDDCRRSRVLHKEACMTAKSMQAAKGKRGVARVFEPSVDHEEDAGRGTVIQVWDSGRMCQVRWDKTGLVAHYNTGAGGHFFLQTWGTSERCVAAWLAIPQGVRATLHEDLVDPEADPYAEIETVQQHLVDKFMDEYNMSGVARVPVSKAKLVGIKHRHPKNKFQQCPRGAGILQRLINELDYGWGQPEGTDDGEPEVRAGMRDGSLWLSLQIKDPLAGRVVDWDLPTSFFEFVARTKGRASEAAAARSGRESKVPSAKSSSSGSTKKAKKPSGRCTPLEERAAHLWLVIDPKMGEALRGRVEEGEVTDALLAFSSQHIRRLSKLDFCRGLGTLSVGLALHLTTEDREDLFRQTDFDKDGYITFLDFLKAIREGKDAEASANRKRREGRFITPPPPDPSLRGRRGKAITWPDVMRKVYIRPASLTFAPAGDIHTVMGGHVSAAFPTRERLLDLEGSHPRERRSGWKDEGWRSRLNEDRENILIVEDRARQNYIDSKNAQM